MSNSFLFAAAARAADSFLLAATAPTSETSEAALAEIDDALKFQLAAEENCTALWVRRARILSTLGRYFDALVSLQAHADINEASIAAVVQEVQADFDASLNQLAPITKLCDDPRSNPQARNTAYRRMMQVDPTSVRARAEVFSADIMRARRLRDSSRPSIFDAENVKEMLMQQSRAIAMELLPGIRRALSDLHAFS